MAMNLVCTSHYLLHDRRLDAGSVLATAVIGKMLHLLGVLYSFLCLVDYALHGLLNFAGGLVHPPFVLQTLVIRQNANCFFHTAFDLVARSAHCTVLHLVKAVSRPAIRFTNQIHLRCSFSHDKYDYSANFT